jgi:hypothetical protein
MTNEMKENMQKHGNKIKENMNKQVNEFSEKAKKQLNELKDTNKHLTILRRKQANNKKKIQVNKIRKRIHIQEVKGV